jgi:alkane 1-monooxygenase
LVQAKNQKLMKSNLRNYLYFFSLTPALVCVFGNTAGGIYTLSNFFYSLVFLGLIEWLTKPISGNEATAKDDYVPKAILFLHIPFQLLSISSLIYGIGSGQIEGQWIWTAALSTGINSGSSAIVVSHELIHQKNKLAQFLGRWLLFTAGNMYFFVDHLRVHHKWVGTAKDHASAQKGENLYFFFLRSSLGQWRGAIKLESERLKKENKSNFLLNHYVYRQFLLHGLLDTFLVWYGGFFLLLVWIFHCVVANFLLEYVNYVQHYGLTRTENTRVTELHSWDSDCFVSRFLLVDLSRHADHHYYASKPYHTLINYDKSPKMPSGYAGLFFIAAIPPLWFAVMNKRIPMP